MAISRKAIILLSAVILALAQQVSSRRFHHSSEESGEVLTLEEAQLQFFNVILNSIVDLTASGSSKLTEDNNTIYSYVPILIKLGYTALGTDLALVQAFEIFAATASQPTPTTPNANDVHFYLYTNNTDPSVRSELFIGNNASIALSGYNAELPLILIASGFTGNTISILDPTVVIKNVYASLGVFGTNANVVLVDWSVLASGPILNPSNSLSYLAFPPAYVRAVSNVEFTATLVGQFLKFMSEYSYISTSPRNVSNVHLFGQSLGAHVVGLGAQYYTRHTGNKILRLTGAEPAGPLFQKRRKNQRFNSCQAVFVDSIRTNEGAFGMTGKVAQADFVVNGGGPIQPTCFNATLTATGLQGILLEAECSHTAAGFYYAQSIVNRTIPATCVGHNCKPLTTYFGDAAQPGTRGTFAVAI